jgi:hypothetical protein
VHRLHLAPGRTGPATLIAAVLLGLAVAGCGGGPAATGRGASSPGVSPMTSPGTTLPTPAAIQTPFNAPWPAGWDDALCAAFAELVVMQELAVDIGRALREGDREDARALTAELAASATAARGLLEQLPDWPPAEPLREDVAGLIGLADEVALRYGRHLNQGRRPALAAAQAAARQMRDVIEPLLDRLTTLADQGLACPGLPFYLEAPPDE